MMVADRRRRVRQAALDALAVLGQIYDSEVLFEKPRSLRNKLKCCNLALHKNTFGTSLYLRK